MRKNRLSHGQKNMIRVISGSSAKRVCMSVLFQSDKNIIWSLIDKGLAEYKVVGNEGYAHLTERGNAANV